uniref:Suppressor of cytokine signaling 5 n=1 Tax=Anopheles farauti TaxID=69004 RepID=A0A499FUZ4_9DIPT
MTHKRFLKMIWPFQDCGLSSREAGSSSTSPATGGTVVTTSNGKDTERIVAAVDDNSSNQPTTVAAAAATLSNGTVSTGSAHPTSGSPPTTTTGSSSSSAVASPASSTLDTKTSITVTARPVGPGSTCRNRKSASSTLFGSLPFAGRRSRSANTTRGSSSSSSTEGATEQQQNNRSRIPWIAGGGSSGSAQKQQRNGGSKNAATGAKTKKSNWPFSLKSSSSASASSGSAGGTSVSHAAKAAAGQSSSAAISSTLDANNSIVSGVGGSASMLRGSSLITSAKLLKGESDKDDSCVCTAYRKVSESPPPPSSSTSPVRLGATMPPARVASPRPTEAVEWMVQEAMPGSGLLPLNLHMLNSLRSGASGGTMVSSQAPLISLSPEPIAASMLPNHHHHHHHAMAHAAALVDHHQSFFFPSAASGVAAANGLGGGAVAAAGTAAAAAGGSLFGTLPAANDVILLSDSPVLFDLSSDDFSVEDCDERARIQRELEIREGVDAPPNFHPRRLMSGGTIASGPAANHPIAFIYSRDLMQRGLLMANKLIQPLDAAGGCAAAAAAAAAGRAGPFGRLRIHSQVDFIHCLVPDLQKITSCSFYWGKMDRYEAERLLEGKPEGTFLLRDSAQEEYLFSVSFRKYNRSLHARIEQFNHKFSFDSRDPGVFTASTVTGLLEHYKDPSCVMFFEPMLTFPLNRNFSFSLQQLCRAVIVSNTTYDGINELTLPKSLKSYLKEYHYRQRVRFRPMDEHLYSNA